jgi:hypothetical protein
MPERLMLAVLTEQGSRSLNVLVQPDPLELVVTSLLIHGAPGPSQGFYAGSSPPETPTADRTRVGMEGVDQTRRTVRHRQGAHAPLGAGASPQR